jgi:adenine phosphoribosyltransferase
MKDVEFIAGLEARGFIFGPLIAAQLGIGFVPIRKKGKLPGEKIFVEYKLEYGSDVIEMQADSLHPGARVAIVDDLIGFSIAFLY